jgi:hypothetical protein
LNIEVCVDPVEQTIDVLAFVIRTADRRKCAALGALVLPIPITRLVGASSVFGNVLVEFIYILGSVVGRECTASTPVGATVSSLV